MKYFWKLGIISSILTLLSYAGMEPAFAKVDYERYNVPYSTPTSKTTPTPQTAPPVKKTTTVKKSTSTSHHKKATTSAPTSEPNIYSKKVIQESRQLPYFSAIDISGPFKVDVATGNGRQSVVLTGNVNAVPRVTSRVIGNTLVIRMLPSKTGQLVPPYNPHVAIQIHMVDGLTTVAAGGSTQVYGTGISSSRLSLNTSDQGSIYLRGNLIVYEINCNSSGIIDVALGHLRGIGVGGAGSGIIRITGSVDMLTAVLGGALRLDAKRLRAQQVYVTTWGNACAEVLPVIALYAFARDISNIFYYKEPQVMSGNSKGSGNILRLANWP
ncbi:MAG TPA: DUF2807 domain-containing protein [Gammaproteobacteria bacterium]|nr:DUF2807 domain-containing protein [Gammaproteobacteria bacterium]